MCFSHRVTGGELFEDIVAREYYSEADARWVPSLTPSSPFSHPLAHPSLSPIPASPVIHIYSMHQCPFHVPSRGQLSGSVTWPTGPTGGSLTKEGGGHLVSLSSTEVLPVGTAQTCCTVRGTFLRVAVGRSSSYRVVIGILPPFGCGGAMAHGSNHLPDLRHRDKPFPNALPWKAGQKSPSPVSSQGHLWPQPACV